MLLPLMDAQALRALPLILTDALALGSLTLRSTSHLRYKNCKSTQRWLTNTWIQCTMAWSASSIAAMVFCRPGGPRNGRVSVNVVLMFQENGRSASGEELAGREEQR